MRLPSSSSLLLASLAVSTSSSSLSALAAPAGGADPPAGSSSSASVPPSSNDTTAQSHRNMQTSGPLQAAGLFLPKELSEELETLIGAFLGILATSDKAPADLSPLSAEGVKEQAQSSVGNVFPAGLVTRGKESGATQDSSAPPPLSQAPPQILEPPVAFPSVPDIVPVQPPVPASPPSRRDSAAPAHQVVTDVPFSLPPLPIQRRLDVPTLSNIPVKVPSLDSST